MRCKKHLTDLTSSIGVCATCLTERLSALIEAQTLAEEALLARSRKADHHAQQDCRRKSDAGHPPPLVFPRSVSPYMSHRKSDFSRPNPNPNPNPNHHHHHHHHHHTLSDQLFFSTPQVGQSVVTAEPNSCQKKRSGNFCLLSRLFFRSRTASSSTRPSWFSNMLSSPSRQKKEPNRSSVDGDQKPPRRWRSDRGMSPARVSDCGDEEFCDFSSEDWKQTPQRPTATPARRGGGHSRNVSGLKFCLSPLVRASPSRQWNQKGIMQPEASVHGEVRLPAVGPRLSTGAANRSRKIADFGRCTHGHR